MKKKIILILMFVLTLFSTALTLLISNNQPVSAAGSDYDFSIKITCNGDQNIVKPPTYPDLTNYKLSINYDPTVNYEIGITFKYKPKGSSENNYTYSEDYNINWGVLVTKNNSSSIEDLTTSKTLTITADQINANQKNLQPMYIGTKTYNLIIKGTGIFTGAQFTNRLRIQFTAENNEVLHMTKDTDDSIVNPSEIVPISKTSESFGLTCPTSIFVGNEQTLTPNWLIKTPYSTTYDLIETNSTHTVNPSNLINQYGYGIYKLFTTVVYNNVLYTSKIVEFDAQSKPPILVSNYKISRKTVENTKVNLEAFNFNLEYPSSEELDTTKLVWFVNETEIANGLSFVYEPTSTDEFVVSVKYVDNVANETVLLDTTKAIKPTSTGLGILIISCCLGALVLIAIFTISVKVFNKRRDVTW